MTEHILTVGQIKRLKSIFVNNNGSPTMINKLLSEIEHPSIIEALIYELYKYDWYYFEFAIRLGKGNISKLETKFIESVISTVTNRSGRTSDLVNVAKIPNISIPKIQNAIIKSQLELDDKFSVLREITKIRGADVTLTLNWFNDVKKRNKAMRHKIDENIRLIEKSYRYRSKIDPKTPASPEQIQDILNLIKVKYVHDS